MKPTAIPASKQPEPPVVAVMRNAIGKMLRSGTTLSAKERHEVLNLWIDKKYDAAMATIVEDARNQLTAAR